MTTDYYKTLEIDRNASESEIKKAFRNLSLKYHPDRADGDTQKFQEINEAYSILSDNEKRKQYDMELNGVNINPGIDEMFNMMFNHGGLFNGFGPDIRIFHNGVPVFHNMMKPSPIVKNAKISLEQAYSGISIPFEIERCIVQNNTKITETETIYINIPPGIDENEMIVIRDKGNVMNGQLRGDIKIIIQIENNTSFQRQGLDLILKKKITLKEALCGFQFEFTHLNGKQLILNNSNENKTIIKPNYKKVVQSMGMKREMNIGNLIIEFDIEFPNHLSEDKIAILNDVL